LSIGNFDGVHLGHQAMVAKLSKLGARLGLPCVLLTFEPHPMELLAPDRAPARLTRFKEKMLAIAQLPAAPDSVACMRFDEALSQMPAQEFVARILVDGFGVRHLLVGHDFHFGHGGLGNVPLLQTEALARDFEFECLNTVQNQGGRVSSTRIREALMAGELDTARQLLGRPYSLCGRVGRGQQLGRQLGFPTANIAPGRNRCSIAGVFTVAVHSVSGQHYRGVANVGKRPTVDGLEERIEVHLFDFDGDLYGRELRVEFLSRLRPEQRFNGLEELTRQIQRDVQAARDYLETGQQA